MDWRQAIGERWEEIVRDLAALVAIRSVGGEAEPGAPYGAGPRTALDYMLRRAEEMGFETAVVDDRVGYVSYGVQQPHAAVLLHLDVVPEGDGWTLPPFALTRREGRLYGRGVSDNKGAAVCALHCLDLIRREGLTGARGLRLIFGTDEERGMGDMKAYIEREPLPEFGFVPDSEYPIISREKGILQLDVTLPFRPYGVRSLEGGASYNLAPGLCRAELDRDFAPLAEQIGFRGRVRGTEVEAAGDQLHAMLADRGENACVELLRLLAADGDARMDTLFQLLSDPYGEGLGIACEDAPSGKLTVCVGQMRLTEEGLYLSLDCRYPVTKDGGALTEAVRRALSPLGAEVAVHQDDPPLYVWDDSEIVKRLSAAYEDLTGERCETLCTGGGSYARRFGGRMVGFGPLFPGTPETFHRPDEYLDEEALRRHAEICGAAMALLLR